MIFVTYLLVIILAVLGLLLVFLFIQLYQIGKMRAAIKELSETINKIKTDAPLPSVHLESPEETQHEDVTVDHKENSLTKKQEVLDAILKRKEVGEEDLPVVIKELSSHFSRWIAPRVFAVECY